MAAQIVRLALKSTIMSTKTRPPSLIQPIRKATTTQSGSFLPEPERQSYGLLAITGTVMLGLFVGATISQNIASFLEENELFVPSDDDDDDD